MTIKPAIDRIAQWRRRYLQDGIDYLIVAGTVVSVIELAAMWWLLWLWL